MSIWVWCTFVWTIDLFPGLLSFVSVSYLTFCLCVFTAEHRLSGRPSIGLRLGPGWCWRSWGVGPGSCGVGSVQWWHTERRRLLCSYGPWGATGGTPTGLPGPWYFEGQSSDGNARRSHRSHFKPWIAPFHQHSQSSSNRNPQRRTPIHPEDVSGGTWRSDLPSFCPSACWSLFRFLLVVLAGAPRWAPPACCLGWCSTVRKRTEHVIMLC